MPLSKLPPANVSQAGESAVTAAPLNAPVYTAADYAPPVNPNQSVYRDDSPQLSGTIQFPSDLPLYYTTLSVHDYKRASWASVGELSPAERVLALPVPEQLVDAQSERIGAQPVGMSGGAGVSLGSGQAFQNIKNFLGSLSTADGVTPNVVAGSGNSGALSGAAAVGAAVAGKTIPDLFKTATGIDVSGLPNGVQAALGYSVNDFLTVMFNGPNYKSFTMSWRLSPRSIDESRAIKRMEIVLKNAQAPSWADSASIFFRWPKIFRIAFECATRANMGDRLYRLKPALLVNSMFNYAPGGVPAFYGASKYPEGVAVSLQFMEIELWVNSSGAQDAYGNPDSAP